MAGKKIPSVDDSIKIFKDVMNRSSLSNYFYVNKIMVGKNAKGKSIIIIPDNELWLKIIEDADLKDNMKELNITDPDENDMIPLFSYGEDLENKSWIDVDIDSLYSGKIIKITVNDLDYKIPINKNLLPLKLRKAEYNNISYRVFTKPSLVLGLKKRFDFPIENYGFTIIRIFKIL